MSLKGQCILVTGASRGIGEAIARELMKQEARVVVHYNSGEEAASELAASFPKTQSIALQANLEETEDIKRLFNESIAGLGKLDSIVLNAGVFIPHPVSMEFGQWWEIWKKTININLNAAGLLTRLGLDHFKEQKGGRFLYIGSRAAFRGETEEYLAYAASKGGLTSLARSVARSYGKMGVTAFTIAPGFTKTEMAVSFMKTHGEARVLKELALGELTLPEHIAPLAAFICSGMMDHATGTTIDINAGSYMH
ncbi:SDR family NAD(P)-dependent oxidoreductase [Robiginitalea sp. IMCC43444]|uniref:SDR family NAD(P)-dependent oxidoreductase n=1 Tax=Robiginitalea sp. IMCC43444 TaxID=3459121 RepID=UPI00404165A1